MDYIIPEELQYSYTIAGDKVEVTDSNGDHVVQSFGIASYPTWNANDKETWATLEINYRYRDLITRLSGIKLDELTKIYNEYMTGLVKLSDGTTFSASKLPGDNPNLSLHNTVRMIQDAASLATYGDTPQESITLSDYRNIDITYMFDYDNARPEVILPVLEIGTYIARYFAAKRGLRNMINQWIDQEVVDYDALKNMDVAHEFAKAVGVTSYGTEYVTEEA